jgi:hypothetical protein
MDTSTFHTTGMCTHTWTLSSIWLTSIKTFNGFSDEIAPPAGCANDSVFDRQSDIITRGVPTDKPRRKAWNAWNQVRQFILRTSMRGRKRRELRLQGDVVFVRTGRWARWAAKGPWKLGQCAAGLHASFVKGCTKRKVRARFGRCEQPAAVASRRCRAADPSNYASRGRLFDNCDLEARRLRIGNAGRFAHCRTHGDPGQNRLARGTPLRRSEVRADFGRVRHIFCP